MGFGQRTKDKKEQEETRPRGASTSERGGPHFSFFAPFSTLEQACKPASQCHRLPDREARSSQTIALSELLYSVHAFRFGSGDSSKAAR
jgi:hypothetical protein